MNLIDMIIEVLEEEKKALHVMDVAELVVKTYNMPEGCENIDILKSKVSASLSSHVKKIDSKVVKVKNPKTKSFRRGVYKIKISRKKHEIPAIPEVSILYTGKAGEYGLLSELLFRRFNASIMTVDEGIDVVASKNKYFHLQVRTSNNHKNAKYYFQIKPSSTFYILILRRVIDGLWRSEYIFLPSIEIRKYIETDIIKSSTRYSLTIGFEKDNCILNSRADISRNLNQSAVLR